MYGVVIAMIPALLVSVYFFGLDAIRVNLIAIAACIFFEWIIQKLLLKGELTITDGSAIVTGMLLAFNVPSNLPWWIIVIGALVSIGIGKMSFGGLGNNPFNPALVGRVFLLISFPVQMTSWPKVQVLNFAMTDAQTGATPLAIVKEGLKNGESFSSIINNLPTSYSDMFFGQMGGSLGEISAIALIIGGLYMLYRKIITWHIPVSIIATVAIFTGILYGINPDKYADPLFHLLTGGLMLGAIFMATDMVTSPMTAKGMIIYGVGIGIITVLIRVWGAYPEGVSFAILIMNAFTPLINYYVKPKRFGEIVKK
jgi:electron transport complex protein RnfD